MPLAGILITDYQFFRGKYKTPHEEISLQFSVPAMVAWIVGFFIAKYSTWGSPAITALLMSGLIHYTLSKLMKVGDVVNSKKDDKKLSA